MTTVDQERLIQSWIAAATSRTPHAASRNRDIKVEQLRHLAMLRLSGRIDELMQHFATDCEMYVGGAAQFSPLSGRARGLDEIRARLQSFPAILEVLDLEFISIIVENDDVAIRWRCQPRERRAATSDWIEGMSVAHFDDGLISYYGNFMDTAALARLLGWKRLVSADSEA